jgi:hypothetical protein
MHQNYLLLWEMTCRPILSAKSLHSNRGTVSKQQAYKITDVLINFDCKHSAVQYQYSHALKLNDAHWEEVH